MRNKNNFLTKLKALSNAQLVALGLSGVVLMLFGLVLELLTHPNHPTGLLTIEILSLFLGCLISSVISGVMLTKKP